MQPSQFNMTREIIDFDEVGLGVLSSENPPDVTVDEAFVTGRMDVLFSIGMQMVMPVFGSPPEDALLRTGLREKCQDELKKSTGGVGPMREVSMVPGPDCKKAYPIEHKADDEGLPGYAGPDCRKAQHVHDNEGNGGRIDDIFVSVSVGVSGDHRLVPFQSFRFGIFLFGIFGLATFALATFALASIGLAPVGLASVGGALASLANLKARSRAVLAATARLSASYSFSASAASRARSSFIESLAALFCVSLEEAMGVSFSGFRSV